MTPQYVFGPGIGWITPTTDSSGVAIPAGTATPVLVAGLQDISLDMSAEVKEMYGTNSYALAIGRGKQKVSIKIKNAQVTGSLWNAMFFGQSLAAGVAEMKYDTLGIDIPATPFTVTAGASDSPILTKIPNTGSWAYNLGVRDVNNIPLQRVASAPTTGQYAVTAGAYLFAAADLGKHVYIDFAYTAASTVAQKLVIANQPMGYAPTFQFDMKIPYQGNVFAATFPNCMATKAGVATKLDDFAYPEFDFSAFAPGAAGVGTLSWSQ